jgi:hypothetical protein
VIGWGDFIGELLGNRRVHFCAAKRTVLSVRLNNGQDQSGLIEISKKSIAPSAKKIEEVQKSKRTKGYKERLAEE